MKHAWNLVRQFFAKYRMALILFPLYCLAPLILLEAPSLLQNRSPSEKIILSKLSKERVPSRFDPVMIYVVSTNNGYREESFVGCGAVCVGKHDTVVRIPTAGHLLHKAFKDKTFVFRSMRHSKSERNGAFQSVEFKGSDLAIKKGETPDVVILRAGKPTVLESFTSRDIWSGINRDSIKSAAQIRLTSLVSGQTVRVIGSIVDKDDGSEYLMLDTKTIRGESGEPFVTENDELVICHGTVVLFSDDPSAVFDPSIVNLKELGSRDVTVAYGPIKVP